MFILFQNLYPQYFLSYRMINIPQDALFNEVVYLINTFGLLKKCDFNFGTKMGKQCHSAVKYMLIECVHLTNWRIRWKFPNTFKHLEEDVNLYNLIKFQHDNNLYYEIYF